MMTPGGGARFMITRVGNKQPQCSVEIFPRLHFQPRRRSSMVLVLAVRSCHGIISHVRDCMCDRRERGLAMEHTACNVIGV